MERQITSPDELHSFARAFLKTLKPHAHSAVVVALNGELGSGKTSFTQAVAKALGVEELVTSPTFVIEKIYKLDKQAFSHLVHIDAYRLNDPSELSSLGWDELVQNPGHLIVIEWADRIKDLLPKATTELSFVYVNETTRSVTMKESHNGKYEH